MYSEKTFKNYIFWIQVKRVFLIILLSCLGAGLGVLIGGILKSTLQTSQYNNIIIVVSTLIFFAISLLLTAGTGKEVQDGYWKIAVLRKLTVIQKDIEINNELMEKGKKPVKDVNLEEILKINEDKKKSGKKIDNKKSKIQEVKNKEEKKVEEVAK